MRLIIISLQRLKNPAQLSRVRAKIRSTRPNKGLRARRPKKRWEKKKKKRKHQRKQDRQKVQDDSYTAIGANATQVTKSQKKSNVMGKALRRTSLRLLTITVIIRAITLRIAPSYKTSCNLGDFHVNDY